MLDNDAPTRSELIEEKLRRRMRGSFWHFFRAYCPGVNYKYGRHTVATIQRLDKAVKDFERGVSTNLMVTMPYRHGKSDIVSRRFPVWALGRNPDAEMILACYGDELANDLSRKARECFREAGWVFGQSISGESAAVGHWEINGRKGAFTATGIGGAVVGRGAGFLVIDDYLKSREEAESQRIRDKQWDCFNDDLRTRLAPTHVIIVCANRWHEDDIAGRALARCREGDKEYDPAAPVFEELRFPMRGEDGSWLFPQRFSRQWYTEQWSNLGTYGQNSLAQQDPRPRQGHLLRADLVTVLAGDEFDRRFAGAHWARGWDLASTRKELVKPDPDYSVGTKATILRGDIGVSDVARGQWTGLKRNEVIAFTARQDGHNTVVYVEVVAGYKDAYEAVTELLSGQAVVRPYTPAVDKVARASVYEPFFELGRVYLRKAAWNQAWIAEHCVFPNGAHDDQVDSMVVALCEQVRATGRIGIST